MISLIFTILMLFFYLLTLRRRRAQGAMLAFTLWGTYFFLGIFGVIGEAIGSISPVYSFNLVAIFALFLAISACISAFLRFDDRGLKALKVGIRFHSSIENFLIFIQVYSILFFLPLAYNSLIGDPHINRLNIQEKMDVIGSYGLFNTFATVGAHLFVPSMIFAILRILPTNNLRRNVLKSLMLFVCSLSYVVYVLAYIGRDGVVYWVMMSSLLVMLFWPYFLENDRRKLIKFLALIFLLVFIPFIRISISRFSDVDTREYSPLFEYFGAQVVNFNDYSSIERPITYGAVSFPWFYEKLCLSFVSECETWADIKPFIFEEYLLQEKYPWLFGTFFSDIAGDFGLSGAFVLVLIFSIFCSIVCSHSFNKLRVPSISRVLFVIFLFQVPYWGVFYFRFSTINSYIIINAVFIIFIAFLQYSPKKLIKENIER